MQLGEERTDGEDVDVADAADLHRFVEKRCELKQVGAIVLDGVGRESAPVLQVFQERVDVFVHAVSVKSFSQHSWSTKWE